MQKNIEFDLLTVAFTGAFTAENIEFDDALRINTYLQRQLLQKTLCFIPSGVYKEIREWWGETRGRGGILINMTGFFSILNKI